MKHNPEFLTVEEAAALLGVKPATLYAYVSRGRLRSYRQGVHRRRLYRRDEIEALLAIQDHEPAEDSGDLQPAERWVSER